MPGGIPGGTINGRVRRVPVYLKGPYSLINTLLCNEQQASIGSATGAALTLDSTIDNNDLNVLYLCTAVPTKISDPRTHCAIATDPALAACVSRSLTSINRFDQKSEWNDLIRDHSFRSKLVSGVCVQLEIWATEPGQAKRQ